MVAAPAPAAPGPDSRARWRAAPWGVQALRPRGLRRVPRGPVPPRHVAARPPCVPTPASCAQAACPAVTAGLGASGAPLPRLEADRRPPPRLPRGPQRAPPVSPALGPPSCAPRRARCSPAWAATASYLRPAAAAGVGEVPPPAHPGGRLPKRPGLASPAPPPPGPAAQRSSGDGRAPGSAARASKAAPRVGGPGSRQALGSAPKEARS